MAHIGCVCGNDVRGNSVETIHRFVSENLMNEYAESETFFRLPYLPGEKRRSGFATIVGAPPSLTTAACT